MAIAIPIPGSGYAKYSTADAALAGYQPIFGGTSGAFTVACWFRLLSSPTDWSGFIGSTTGGSWSNGCGAYFWGGTLRIWVGNYGTHSVVGPALTLRKWYHLAIVYDGSFVRFYLDGTSRGTPAAKTGTVTHGVFNVGSNMSDNVACEVDTVGIWSTGLSAGQVMDLYESKTTFEGLPASVRGPSLVHWWDTDTTRQVWPSRGSMLLYAVSPTAWSVPQPAGFVGRGGVSPMLYAASLLLAAPTTNIPVIAHHYAQQGVF